MVFILDTLNLGHSAEPTYMQKSNNQNLCSECGKNPLKRATFYSSVIDTTTGKFTNTDIMFINYKTSTYSILIDLLINNSAPLDYFYLNYYQYLRLYSQLFNLYINY